MMVTYFVLKHCHGEGLCMNFGDFLSVIHKKLAIGSVYLNNAPGKESSRMTNEEFEEFKVERMARNYAITMTD